MGLAVAYRGIRPDSRECILVDFFVALPATFRDTGVVDVFVGSVCHFCCCCYVPILLLPLLLLLYIRRLLTATTAASAVQQAIAVWCATIQL